jgi:hypothetical protein
MSNFLTSAVNSLGGLVGDPNLGNQAGNLIQHPLSTVNGWLGNNVAPPPGILQGAPVSQARLQQRPDGTFFDPVTGQSYSRDPSGQFAPIANPNTAQQVGAAAAGAAGYAGQVPGYDAREAAAYGNEGNLAATLNRMAMGQGPTVAGTQLAGGLDQAARAQLAASSGQGGNAAVLNRMAMAGNLGQLDSQYNQQQAMLRAHEQQGALGQLGQLYGNMQSQSEGMAGQKISAANYLNGLAMQGESGREGAAQDAAKTNAGANMGLLSLGLQGYGAYKSAKGTVGG